MKHLQLLLLAVLLTATACTHNNGDIGDWFGTWTIDEITKDGTAVNLDPANDGSAYFIQFQTSVVCLRKTDDRHNSLESYGTWQENGDQLTIDLPDEHARDIYFTGMNNHNTFTISSRDSKNVVMETVDDGGVRYRYTLRKLY